jgi:hypothetical protein
MKKQRLNVKQMLATEAANIARRQQSMNKEIKPRTADPNNPRTLNEARARIAALNEQLAKQKLPSSIEPSSATTLKRPSVEKAVVATVKSKAANLDHVSLAAIQEQLDATTGADARIALLQRAAKDFQARIAANRNDMSAESQELFKAKVKIERRCSYELLAAGKLRDAFKIQPEDLV